MSRQAKFSCLNFWWCLFNFLPYSLASFVWCLLLNFLPYCQANFSSYTFDDFSDRHAESNLSAECNEGCGCSAAMYEPVCGFDGSIYFSPCHAGCSLQYHWNKGPMGPYKVIFTLLVFSATINIRKFLTFNFPWSDMKRCTTNKDARRIMTGCFVLKTDIS